MSGTLEDVLSESVVGDIQYRGKGLNKSRAPASGSSTRRSSCLGGLRSGRAGAAKHDSTSEDGGLAAIVWCHLSFAGVDKDTSLSRPLTAGLL